MVRPHRLALSALQDLLVRPERFFETRRLDALLPYAVGAVLLTVVASVVGFWVVGAATVATVSPAYGRAFDEALGTLAVVVPLSALLMWIVVAGVAHLLVRNQVPSATFERTFTVVALAAVLEIPVILLGLADAYLALRAAPPVDTAAAVREATERGPILLGAWVAVTLWKGYLWREGLRGAYDLDRVRATNAAGAAVVVALLAVVLG